jgi:hypothetical protein
MNTPPRSPFLFVAAVLLATLALALPGGAYALGCRTADCTYHGWLGDYPGHCGPHDTECYCFCDEDPEYHQQQDACIDIEQ